MLETRIACPYCNKRLKCAERVLVGDRFRCPGCQQSFNVQGKDLLTPPALGYACPGPPTLIGQALDTMPAVALPPAPPGYRPIPVTSVMAPAVPQRSGRPVVLIAGFCFFFLALGVGLAIGLSGDREEKAKEDATADSKRPSSDSRPEADGQARKREPAEPDAVVKKPGVGDEEKQDEKTRPPLFPPDDDRRVEREPVRLPLLPKQVPPLRSSLPRERQEEVNKSVDKGVEYLKQHQSPTGTWGDGQHSVGLAALPALTLLECGVNATDPVVQRALGYVRREAPGEMMTYDISLAILFLDRYGDPRDRRLIQSLALRLMAGQTANGGWNYNCRNVFSAREELEFFDVLRQTRPKEPLELFDGDKGDRSMAWFVETLPKPQSGAGRLEGLISRPDAPLAAALAGPFFSDRQAKIVSTIEATDREAVNRPLEDIKTPKVKLDDLPPKLRDLPVLRPLPKAGDLKPLHRDRTDNSNSQFAILGVWAAARHNIPMERTLALLVKRYRASQNTDGTWGYLFGTGGHVHGSPAMICSGLLGLAIGHGLVAGVTGDRAKPITDDPAVQKAMKVLSTHLDPTNPMPPRGMRQRAPGARGMSANCYFLWSLERVGVLYNLVNIGESDWYAWGVDILLPRQMAGGNWAGAYGHSDTCFALLFLKRANLTHDLTTKIQYLKHMNELKARKQP